MDGELSGKTLLVLRHAKSDWDRDLEDHERPLSARGERDGVAVGRLLASRDIVVDLVACSTATRTRETWDRAVQGGGQAREVRYLDQIYGAGVPELVEVVRSMPESAKTVLLIGHAPGIPNLVTFLAVRRAGSAAWAKIDQKFPTSGLAFLDFTGVWADADRERAELTAFEAPRG